MTVHLDLGTNGHNFLVLNDTEYADATKTLTNPSGDTKPTVPVNPTVPSGTTTTSTYRIYQSTKYEYLIYHTTAKIITSQIVQAVPEIYFKTLKYKYFVTSGNKYINIILSIIHRIISF